MQLEEMGKFFDARVDGYEEHMYTYVDGADEYYARTAELVPRKPLVNILDLGCGTGLELDEIYRLVPDAQVTGIDLSPMMLNRLREKHAGKNLTLINDSYFDVPFGSERYDVAVSVQTLHHFERALKVSLYKKIHAALRSDGIYIETDYVAADQAYEDFHFAECARQRAEMGITEGFYHYDTPNTVENLVDMLSEAGFSSIELIWRKTNTAILRCAK